MGDLVKLARLLLFVAIFGISWSVARADSTDPKVFTSGCGGKGQPVCDPDFLTQQNPTSIANVTFTFLSETDPNNPLPGTVTAFDDIANLSGVSVNHFILTLSPDDSNNDPLTYSCGTPPANTTGSFTCTQIGVDTFDFLGGPICSVPTDPTGISELLFLQNPTCQYGERFYLQASTDAGDKNPDALIGQSVTGSLLVPEPASGLLLLIGLCGGAFVLRKRALNLV